VRPLFVKEILGGWGERGKRIIQQKEVQEQLRVDSDDGTGAIGVVTFLLETTVLDPDPAFTVVEAVCFGIGPRSKDVRTFSNDWESTIVKTVEKERRGIEGVEDEASRDRQNRQRPQSTYLCDVLFFSGVFLVMWLSWVVLNLLRGEKVQFVIYILSLRFLLYTALHLLA